MPKRKTTSPNTGKSTSKQGNKKQKIDDPEKRKSELLAAGFTEYGGALTDSLLDQLLGDKKDLKVLFPLCADSIDMKRLYERGHQVIGIEISKSMIIKFFKKRKLEYTVKNTIAGQVYSVKLDGRLRIYCCDFFNFNAKVEGGNFDVVVDQRAICSLFPHDKPRYVKKVKSLLSPNFIYVFDTFDIDRTKLPKSKAKGFNIKEVEGWFGKGFKIEIIQTLSAGLTIGQNHLSLVLRLFRK